MKKTFQILGILVAFLLILSITIKGQPLFSYIYDVLSPATKFAQNKAEEFFQRSVTGTQAYSRKIFQNSVPRVRDTVKSKLSAPQKGASGEPEEKISVEEKQQLDDLIKNH